MEKLHYQHIRGTTEEWNIYGKDIVVADGEIALEFCPDGSTKIKVGNGIHNYFELPYATASPFYNGLKENSIQSILSQAISQNAFAAGEGSVAGGKGYKLTAFTNNGDGTGVCTLRTVDGLEVGMPYALKCAYACFGTIIEISGLTVTVDGVFDRMRWEDNDIEDAEQTAVENYLVVVDKPDLGDTDVSFNAVSFGRNCKAQGIEALTIGRDNVVFLPYGVALGRNNKAGYAAAAFGYINEASGDMSFTAGHENIASGWEAFATGVRTKALGIRSATFGYYTQAVATNAIAEGLETEAASPEQHVQGRYNVIDGSGIYALIIGNGTSAERSNAHTVSWKGDGWFKNALYLGGTGQYSSKAVIGIGENAQSISLGDNCTIAGGNGLVIGTHCIVNAWHSFAGGYYSEVNGPVGFAFGEFAKIEKQDAQTNTNRAVVFGLNTIANSSDQLVHGKYNKKDIDKAHIVGWGSGDKDRKNIYALDKNGNGEFAGTVKAGRATTDDDNDLVLVTKGYLKNLLQTIKSQISEMQMDITTLKGNATVYPTPDPGGDDLPGYDM